MFFRRPPELTDTCDERARSGGADDRGARGTTIELGHDTSPFVDWPTRAAAGSGSSSSQPSASVCGPWPYTGVSGCAVGGSGTGVAPGATQAQR